nr:vitellogenin-1-like isoform X2 [Misgurnus anguillicaudatus]
MFLNMCRLGTSRSVGRDRSTSRTSRSVGRDRSTSRTSRSVGRDRSTSRTSRSVGRDKSTCGLSRSSSMSRDSSSSRSSTSVGRDSLSSVPRSQAVESKSIDGLTHESSKYNRTVPTTFPMSEAKFQKIVLTKLVTLTDEVKKLQRSMPHSGIEITRMDTLEEFQREEASLQETTKFETLSRPDGCI